MPKRAALVLLAVLVAVLSSPTWIRLVEPTPAPPPWVDEGFIAVVADTPSGWKATAQLIGGIESSSYATEKHVVAWGLLHFWFQSLDGSGLPTPLYIVATNGAESWLTDCSTPFGAPVHATNGPVPGMISVESEHLSVIEVHDEWLISCRIPSELWTANEATHTFQAPAIVVGLRNIPALDQYSHASPKVPRTEGYWCSAIDIDYTQGLKVEYQDPAPTMTTDDSAFRRGGHKIRWRACMDPEDVSPGASDTSVELPASVVRFTDIAEADAAERNLFLAGAFVGFLGGLVVEIISSSFDSARRSGTRRRPGKLKQWKVRIGRWYRRRRRKEPEQLTLWD